MDSVRAIKYEAFSEVASSVVHEMKNPLSAITLGMEYLQLKDVGPDTRTDVITNISAAVVRLNDMLENLHLFFTDDNWSMKKTPIKASEVLKKAKGLMNYYLTRNRIRLESEVSCSEPWIVASEGQLMTMLFLTTSWLVRRMGGDGWVRFSLEDGDGGLVVKVDAKPGVASGCEGISQNDDMQTAEALIKLAIMNGARADLTPESCPTTAVKYSFPAAALK